MFNPKIYTDRRKILSDSIENGLILLIGNNPVPMNYPSNWLRFRQDSNFLYFSGLDFAHLNIIIDVDSGESTLFGDELSVDDIVWEGSRTSIKEMAILSGINHIKPLKDLKGFIATAKRKIHHLPLYREDQRSFIRSLGFEESINSSKSLIKTVIKQRSIKAPEELFEIESALEITAEMHKIAMRKTKEGVFEQAIVGQIEGYALQHGRRLAYPVIFTVNGEILHSNVHTNKMKSGQLALNDSGAESQLHYASDITRTFPVNGKFSSLQKDIYNIVYEMQKAAFEYCKPGSSYKDAHLCASKIAVQGLKDLGLMKGDVDEAVASGAHALFFPHGLGHMLGLDVHDMEGLGEDLVGYSSIDSRSDQFGLAYLRLSRKLEKGFVLTVEPGIYFIPHLIDKWRSENKNKQFIKYDSLNNYKDFGGIRIEDNIVITSDGHKVLGPSIPRTINEIESIMT